MPPLPFPSSLTLTVGLAAKAFTTILTFGSNAGLSVSTPGARSFSGSICRGELATKKRTSEPTNEPGSERASEPVDQQAGQIVKEPVLRCASRLPKKLRSEFPEAFIIDAVFATPYLGTIGFSWCVSPLWRSDFKSNAGHCFPQFPPFSSQNAAL